MKKQTGISMVIALALFSLTACTVEEESISTKKDKEIDVSYSKELSAFIYHDKENPLYFAGTLDYAHSLSVQKVVKERGKEIVATEIALYDLILEENMEEDAFYKQKLLYTIEKDTVKEHLEQAGYDDPKNFVTDKVVLKTPLVEGNKWNQTVVLADGQEYKSETKIEKVTGKKGERKVTTVTTINGEGFEDYPDEQYEEKAVYEEGKGLTSFERFYPNEDGGFIFEYHIDKEKPNNELN